MVRGEAPFDLAKANEVFAGNFCEPDAAVPELFPENSRHRR